MKVQYSRKITAKEFFKLLIGVAIPVSIGFYTAVTNEQVQRSAKLAAQEQYRIATERREFDLVQAQERYQQQLYKDFLDDMYTLHKDGQLDEEAAPWAFANARYRAAHREFDTIRKVEALQFLKDKELIGRYHCTTGCEVKHFSDIIRLDGLNFDDLNVTSGVGSIKKLNLTCIQFNQVSMVNSSFSNINLNGAVFNKSRLNSVRFNESSINCALFYKTNLNGTYFTNSTLNHTHFVNVDLSTTTLISNQKEEPICRNLVTTADNIILSTITTTSIITTGRTTKTTITTSLARLTTTKIVTSGTNGLVYGVAYKLLNIGNNKAMDVENSNTNDGANVHLYTDDGRSSQRWIIYLNQDGTAKLVNQNSIKVLSIDDSNPTVTTNVLIRTDSGTSAQKWNIYSLGYDTYKLLNVMNGAALDAYFSGATDETNIWTFYDNGTNAQKWYLIRV